jgi:putative PIN family toxin of toxin-antitoxin system
MIRAVLDSNIFVSALLFGGNPRQVINLTANGSFELCCCNSIRAEVELVLGVKFGWPRPRVVAATGYLWSLARFTEPQFKLSDCSDPDDNRVLECALEAGAGYLVTGDQHLLVLHPYRGIAIVTPRQFLERKAWVT